MNTRLALLTALLLFSACYSYRPVGSVDTVSLKPGTRVSLTLTETGVAEYSTQLGPQATYIEGDLLEADTAGLRLAIRRVEDARRTGIDWKGEQVMFPRNAIARVSQRRLSVGATALVGGLAVGGMIGAYAAFGTEGSANGIALPPGNPSQ